MLMFPSLVILFLLHILHTTAGVLDYNGVYFAPILQNQDDQEIEKELLTPKDHIIPAENLLEEYATGGGHPFPFFYKFYPGENEDRMARLRAWDARRRQAQRNRPPQGRQASGAKGHNPRRSLAIATGASIIYNAVKKKINEKWWVRRGNTQASEQTWAAQAAANQKRQQENQWRQAMQQQMHQKYPHPNNLKMTGWNGGKTANRNRQQTQQWNQAIQNQTYNKYPVPNNIKMIGG